MAEKFEKDDIALLATLKAEVEQLKKQRESDAKIIQGLQKWHDRCTTGALIWASICAAGMAICTFFISNFEKIKYLLAVKQ